MPRGRGHSELFSGQHRGLAPSPACAQGSESGRCWAPMGSQEQLVTGTPRGI